MFSVSSELNAHLKTKVVNNVCVVTIDSPGQKVFIYLLSYVIHYNFSATNSWILLFQVNSLNEEIMAEVTDVLKTIRSDSSIQAAVLISGKKGNFIAGADLKMLGKAKTKEEVTNISKNAQDILQSIEDLPKPIIAAIAGSCLGGGLEVCKDNILLIFLFYHYARFLYLTVLLFFVL